MRISELAKKIGVKSVDVIAELEKNGVEGKKASSSIDESMIEPISKKLAGKTPVETKPVKKATAKKSTAKKTTAAKTASPAPTTTPKTATKPITTAPKEEKKPTPVAKTVAPSAPIKPAVDKKALLEEEKRLAKEAKKKAEQDQKKQKKEKVELRDIERQIEEEDKKEEEAELKNIVIDEAITVKEFAEKMNISVNEVIKNLFVKGTAVTVNQTLGIDLAKEVAQELGFTLKIKTAETDLEDTAEKTDFSSFPLRPPVVTVMGHVDHGKTSLLDTIRKTNVADKEAGGITQHIGASVIPTPGGVTTFLDTPGHEAFTALRARGAQVTDMVILVVAADDGVMPQTVEAINHAKAANVDIIVAVNKIDKPDAQPDKVKQELSKYDLIPEEWGGTTIFCYLSAKTGEGIDNLMEMIHLQAEMMELRAEHDSEAHAIVIESKLDKTRGPIHSIIVTKGTLKVGDPFVVSNTYGKVRAMFSDTGKKIDSAGPSIPVELLGANEIAQTGEMVTVVENDRKARQISNAREDASREKKLEKKHVRLENVIDMVSDGEILELKMVIKADTQGSVEAVKELLGKLEFKEVKIHVIHSGVGAITETDVSLADASDAIIVGFNVRPTDKANSLSEKTEVELRLYSIIYEITGDVKASVKGMMKPKIQEESLGRAEVRNTFKASKIGTIAGCMILEGLVRRNAECRLVRDSVVVHTGILSSVRRFKDDVKEVQNGYECGLSIEKFNDIKVGDFIEVFHKVEIAPEL